MFRRLLFPPALALLTFALPLPYARAQDDTVTVEIKCNRDTLLEEAHHYNNDGAWNELWEKNGNGINRGLTGCDVTDLAGRASDIVSVKIRLRILDVTGSANGTQVNLHLFDPNAGFDWVEGSGRQDTTHYCNKPQYHRAPYIPRNNGATWKCADDPDVGDGKNAGCTTPWEGGEPYLTQVASASAVVFNTDPPSCSASLAQYARTGSLDAWAKVEWDITADVVAALEVDRYDVSWFIKKDKEVGPGALWTFGREAICVGLPDLGPRLIVTLHGGAPVITDPADDNCGQFGLTGHQ